MPVAKLFHFSVLMRLTLAIFGSMGSRFSLLEHHQSPVLSRQDGVPFHQVLVTYFTRIYTHRFIGEVCL